MFAVITHGVASLAHYPPCVTEYTRRWLLLSYKKLASLSAHSLTFYLDSYYGGNDGEKIGPGQRVMATPVSLRENRYIESPAGKS